MKISTMLFLASLMFLGAGITFTFLAWFNYVEGEVTLTYTIVSRIVIWSIPTIISLIIAICVKIHEKRQEKYLNFDDKIND